jgi:hypothetical protein
MFSFLPSRLNSLNCPFPRISNLKNINQFILLKLNVQFRLNIDITPTDCKESSSDFVVGLSSYFLSEFVLQILSETNKIFKINQKLAEDNGLKSVGESVFLKQMQKIV